MRSSIFTTGLLAWTLALTVGHGASLAENWPQWRGPEETGSVETGNYPVKFSKDAGLLWKTTLPGKGCSTPIVWKRNVVLTVPIDGNDAVLGLDWSGKEQWRALLGPEAPGKHRNGSGSNPSPVTDGSAIFTLFKSGLLAAVDFNGTVLWKTNLLSRFGQSTLYWDFGTSPVLASGNVHVAILHQGESYIAAFDAVTGALRWKVSRNFTTPTENDHSYATPLVLGKGDTASLLVWGAEHLTAHSLRDGSTVWSCGDFNPEGKANWVAVSSPVIAGDMAVVPFGRGSRLHGIRLGGSGNVTQSHRAWVREGTGTFVPSPVTYKQRVYMVRDRGEVECVDPVTGKTLWAEALPKDRASYYASPTIAGGKLYAAREDGVVFVAALEPRFVLLSENPMGEQIIASPVPVANRLLLRGERTLFCVDSGPQP